LSRFQQLYLGGEGKGAVFAFLMPEVQGIIFPASGALCCLNFSQKACGRKRRGRREREEAGAAPQHRGRAPQDCALHLPSILSFPSSILSRPKLLLLVKWPNMSLAEEEQPLVFQQ